MSRQRDAAKEQYWRAMVRDWLASELGTGEYCRLLGIPASQLHWWKRTIQRRDQEAEATDVPEPSRKARGDQSADLGL